jgi:hypothetical protein
MKTKIKVTDPKKEERIAERIFTVQSAYAFLVLAIALGGATNYLSNYFYDVTKQAGTNHIHVIMAFVVLLGSFFMIHRVIKKLDK